MPAARRDRGAVDPTLACAARGVEPCRCAPSRYSRCQGLITRVPARSLESGSGVVLTRLGEQVLAHASQLHALPAGVTMHTAVLTEPLSVSVHGLLRRPPVDGEPVLIVGAGIIGLTALAALRRLVPASEVTVLARHPHQAAAAESLGAHHVVVPGDGYEYLGELAELGGGTVVGRKDAP